MLWALESLGAAAVVCDKETHGRVLGVAGEHCSSQFPSSQGICVSRLHTNIAAEWQNCSYCLFGGMLHWSIILTFNKTASTPSLCC